jgi:hypothetical protein
MEAFSNSNFGFLGLGQILELELLGGMHGFPVVVSGKKKIQLEGQHCTQNSLQICLDMKLRGLVPNFSFMYL